MENRHKPVRIVANITNLLISWFIFAGCQTVNKNPDVLLSDPYNKVTYVSDPGESFHTVEVIQVTTRSTQANVLNTIPQLFMKALEWSGQERVWIGNIRLTTFSKQEEFEIPFQECGSPLLSAAYRRSCRFGSCMPGEDQQGYYQRTCWTEYRTEIRDVLYQKATADILTPGNED